MKLGPTQEIHKQWKGRKWKKITQMYCSVYGMLGVNGGMVQLKWKQTHNLLEKCTCKKYKDSNSKEV